MEAFLFDDFFVSLDPSDPGEEMVVELSGRQVPLRVKRGLSLSDRSAANSQAVKTRVTPDGKLEVVSVDQEIFQTELLFRCLKSWPFTFSNGEHVPITREYIKAMFGENVDAITANIQKRMKGVKENKAPFSKPSAKPSGAH